MKYKLKSQKIVTYQDFRMLKIKRLKHVFGLYKISKFWF